MTSAAEREQAGQPGGGQHQSSDERASSVAGPADVEIDGARLREQRKLMGENLKAFAARAGITFQYLSQLELGVRRRVSPPVFARICDALGVDDRREMMIPDGALRR